MSLRSIASKLLKERRKELESAGITQAFKAKPPSSSLPTVYLYRAQAVAIKTLAEQHGVTVDELIHKILEENLNKENLADYKVSLTENINSIITKKINGRK